VPLLDGRRLDLNFHRFLPRINLDFGLVLAGPPAGYSVIPSDAVRQNKTLPKQD
jgi:hypothetical protein